MRTATKYALNSEYAPISDMRIITRQYRSEQIIYD